MLKESFLSRFTPSLLSPEALEAIFVQREPLAERLVDLITESALTGNKHYMLLVGPRGIGKTHMVSLVYHRVCAKEDLRDRLLIAWLREEEWGIASYLDLLLSILRALQEETKDQDLAERCAALRKLSAEEAEAEAERLLRSTVAEKTLLVIAENLDEIFDGLDTEGQEKLRAYTQNHPFLAILATSPSLMPAVSLRDSPFYGFFETTHLAELSFHDAVAMLSKIAEHEGQTELAAMLATPRGRARVRAVHHIAAGNPRVYVIFSQFLTRESLDELKEPLLRTLDDLTPYYQARMAHLSPQQRKLVEFLCERRGAASVADIAQGTFVLNTTVATQLKRLKENGYVRSQQIGRESYYELREPLMRISLQVKKLRGEPILWFVEFLRVWYSREELSDQLSRLQPEAEVERRCIALALEAKQGQDVDPAVAACVKDIVAHVESEDAEATLAIADELVFLENSPLHHLIRGICLGVLGRMAESDAALEETLAFDPASKWEWFCRAFALDRLGLHEKAAKAYRNALARIPNNPLVWRCYSDALFALSRYDEALSACDRAIELDSADVFAWNKRASILLTVGQKEEAKTSLRRCIEIDPSSTQAWRRLGSIQDYRQEYEEALAAFEKSIELLGENADFRLLSRRAVVLMLLQREEEGRDALEESMAHLPEPNFSRSIAAEETIVSDMLVRTRDEATWRKHISVWIELFREHDMLAYLALSLAGSICTLSTARISDEVARAWRDLWQEEAAGLDMMELPVRLLDAAVEFQATKDKRFLLALPVEERMILEPLLNIPEEERTSHDV